MTAFDKHYAKANFVRQYQAFEVLGDARARKRYDAALNGGHHLDLYAEPRAYARASAFFHGYFGKHLWRTWEMGTQARAGVRGPSRDLDARPGGSHGTTARRSRAPCTATARSTA